ncbi:hypothetical protein DB32_006741 [Sandaracinus amylolyticus]|uniref:Uncharacterized protein n=1 Tax=Sandaracinus amylolyticus TaxID=927083 RepID=A0A0F6W7S3_9BACT|nr:hypothetical protein DB32_006741 [Sandaracinus amylolyticus]
MAMRMARERGPSARDLHVTHPTALRYTSPPRAPRAPRIVRRVARLGGNGCADIGCERRVRSR